MNTTCGHNRYTAGCEGCRRRHRIKEGRRQLRIADGTHIPKQPAAPIRDHLRKLRDAGMHIRAVATASRVPVSTLYNIAEGKVGMVFGDTAAAVLAVQPPEVAVPPAGYSPAIGPRRRAQGLAAMGYSIRWQREQTGIPPAVYVRLVGARTAYIATRHADAIADLFRRCATVRGPSAYAVTWARRQGWAPPAAWDDLDDPSERPKLGRGSRSSRQQTSNAA